MNGSNAPSRRMTSHVVKNAGILSIRYSVAMGTSSSPEAAAGPGPGQGDGSSSPLRRHTSQRQLMAPRPSPRSGSGVTPRRAVIGSSGAGTRAESSSSMKFSEAEERSETPSRSTRRWESSRSIRSQFTKAARGGERALSGVGAQRVFDLPSSVKTIGSELIFFFFCIL